MTWVASMGGPLVVVPRSAVRGWGGATRAGFLAGEGDGGPDDYDRACEVDGWAGVIGMGAVGALVLADEPAMTCFLPGRLMFVRWLAADSEAEVLAVAERVRAGAETAWEDAGIWVTDGPAVLMDSAEAGADLAVEYPGGGLPEQAPVAVPAGRWRVRAAYGEGECTSVVVIRLTAC
ncbi:Imm21 family immunity protein [Streptomyces sp. SID11385]|uniref:Imm21 family immunity protein n=1 Tax=Streptomyces sp. SID11385 TaxID=2706031 RepID=UPI0013CC5EC5|nr:hypothetical protein [Streptomyces sp. SID11385]